MRGAFTVCVAELIRAAAACPPGAGRAATFAAMEAMWRTMAAQADNQEVARWRLDHEQFFWHCMAAPPPAAAAAAAEEEEEEEEEEEDTGGNGAEAMSDGDAAGMASSLSPLAARADELERRDDMWLLPRAAMTRWTWPSESDDE